SPNAPGRTERSRRPSPSPKPVRRSAAGAARLVWYAALRGGRYGVQVARHGGDEPGRGLEVGQLDDLVGRVHVAVRDADEARRHAAARAVDGVGIGPRAPRGRAELVR